MTSRLSVGLLGLGGLRLWSEPLRGPDRIDQNLRHIQDHKDRCRAFHGKRSEGQDFDGNTLRRCLLQAAGKV